MKKEMNEMVFDQNLCIERMINHIEKTYPRT